MALLSTAIAGAADLAQRCAKARQTTTGWEACCPAHDDRTPSLSIRPKDDRILLYCHAGCTAEEILAALGLTTADLFVGPPSAPPPARRPTRQPRAAVAPAAPAGPPRVTARYPYPDAYGTPQFRVQRWEPGFNGAKKSFTQQRPDPDHPGHWLDTMDSVTRVLYNLPAVQQGVAAGERIYVPEGEQDANNLIALGLIATTNAGGADQWEPQYTATLRSAHVVILQDNDAAGQRHTARLTTALHGHAASLRVLELPGLPPKGDVSDWLAAGGTRAQLEALVAAQPLWEPSAARASASLQATATAAEVLPPRKPYVKPPLCPPLPVGARCLQSWEQAAPWLEAYVQHSRHWSPRGMQDAHMAVGLWLLSTVAAGRLYTQVGSTRVFPVLFLGLIARSTMYPKSTTVQVGTDLLKRAGCAMFLSADRSTPQALLRTMSGVVPPSYAAADDQRKLVIQQRLAFAAQRSWYYSEWGGMLKDLRRQDSPMAEFHALLRVLDDGQEYFSSDTIQRGLEEIFHPHLSLLTAATPHDLARFMVPGSALWHDGFWPRFAFMTPQLDEKPSHAPMPREPYHIPAALIEPLHTWHTALGIPRVDIEALHDSRDKPTGGWRAPRGPFPQREVPMSPAVYEAYEAYNDGLLTLVDEGTLSEDYDASYGRFHAKALRIALLLAGFAGAQEIAIHHWAYAQQIVEGWRRNLHTLVAHIEDKHPLAPEQLDEEKITRYVRRVGRATARDIARFTKVGPSMRLAKLLEGMVKNEVMIRAQEGKKTLYGILPEEGEPVVVDDDEAPPS